MSEVTNLLEIQGVTDTSTITVPAPPREKSTSFQRHGALAFIAAVPTLIVAISAAVYLLNSSLADVPAYAGGFQHRLFPVGNPIQVEEFFERSTPTVVDKKIFPADGGFVCQLTMQAPNDDVNECYGRTVVGQWSKEPIFSSDINELLPGDRVRLNRVGGSFAMSYFARVKD